MPSLDSFVVAGDEERLMRAGRHLGHFNLLRRVGVANVTLITERSVVGAAISTSASNGVRPPRRALVRRAGRVKASAASRALRPRLRRRKRTRRQRLDR
jgi:hypothetical protein